MLTDSDKQLIEKALSDIDKALKEFARAKAAGLDIAAEETQLLEKRNRLQKIYQVYFPMGRS